MRPVSPFWSTTSFNATSRGCALAVPDLRVQHQAPFLEVVAREDRIDRVEHVLGRDVGEEAEAATIDAEQRHAARGDMPSGVQQCAVAANGHHDVDALRELRFGDDLDAISERWGVRLPWGEYLDAAFTKMSEQLLRRFRNAWLAQTSPEADRFELLRHPSAFFLTVARTGC